MPYKESPIPSIEAEGGIEVHVNNFFTKHGLPHRYEDVLRLKDLRIGKRKLSKQQAADEIGVARTTLIKWWKKIDESNN